jgi:hypothetical protein
VALAPIIGPNLSLPFIRATTFATHLKRQRRKRLGPSLRHHQIDRPALGDTRQAALSLSLPSPAPALRHQLIVQNGGPPGRHVLTMQTGNTVPAEFSARSCGLSSPLTEGRCGSRTCRCGAIRRLNVTSYGIAGTPIEPRPSLPTRLPRIIGASCSPPKERPARRSWGCRPHPGAYRQAMIREQSFEGRRKNLNQANKLSRSYATLLEALNRHCTVA